MFNTMTKTIGKMSALGGYSPVKKALVDQIKSSAVTGAMGGAALGGIYGGLTSRDGVISGAVGGATRGAMMGGLGGVGHGLWKGPVGSDMRSAWRTSASMGPRGQTLSAAQGASAQQRLAAQGRPMTANVVKGFTNN